MPNSKTLVNNIKRELRRQNLTYALLAEKMDTAESTIKKMFAKSNFSLTKLDQICDVLGVDLLEMIEPINEEANKLSSFTVGQEKQLVQDSKLLLIAYAAINFWSVNDILYRYDIELDEVVGKLKILESFGLLDLRANNRIRPRVSNNFAWLPDGPLATFFRSHFLPDFFDHDFKESGALRVIRYGDLTAASKQKLNRKCMELVDLYDKLSFEDRHHPPGNRGRESTTLVVAYRSWTIAPWAPLRKGD